MSGQEQTPILCSECLGPATAEADGTVVCGYCRHRGVLPPDQLQRAMELDRRIRRAADAVAQMRGTEAALGHIFESPWAFARAAGTFFVLAVLVGGYSAFSSWQHISKAPKEVQASLMLNNLIGPVALAGFGLSVAVALAISRRSYRRKVRPLLFARAPAASGLPARCRACGGPLPDVRDAFVSCVYCNTQNLVTGELEKNRHQLLSAEQQFYQDRAHQVIAATVQSAPNTKRILVVSLVLVYGTILGLSYLSNALLPS